MNNSSSPSRNAPMWVTALLGVLAVVFAIIAVIYFADTAAKLPSFLPGHQSGSAHHHAKHGIVAAILAVLALAGAWLSGGTRRSA
ncbi:MAG: hypothetical protein M3O28_11165 [Actinomycetota bacterium]|nr:hypothetical protein [Actinomycetota bacterium]